MVEYCRKKEKAPLGMATTGGAIIFPITYILSDLFSEAYGYRWSRITCYLAFAMSIIMVLSFQIAIAIPAPNYWVDQEAFKTILGSTPRILFASLIGYVVGDMMNDKVFRRMRGNQKNMKGFGVRAVLSSLVGECCDSSIFVMIAFAGTLPTKTLAIMAFTQVILKVGYEIVILPLTIYFTKKTIEYERAALD